MNPTSMQNNPLDHLKDIHLPDAVSWWPLAWPWWILSILLITAITLLICFYIKNKWRKQVVAELNSYITLNDLEFAQACNRLLKQVALNKIGRECCNYHGIKWLNYLDAQVKSPIFLPKLENFSKWLDDPNANVDRHALSQACEKWIRKVRC